MPRNDDLPDTYAALVELAADVPVTRTPYLETPAGSLSQRLVTIPDEATALTEGELAGITMHGR